MRVLLTNHFPFHGSGTGTYTYDLAVGLQAAGHEVRCLIVDRQPDGNEPFEVERIVCRADDPQADLPFDFPCFTSHPRSANTFADLTTDQIAQYREAIRRRLDQIIDRYNPHIVHCQHIWLMGQLALESGVPYVLSAQGTDLMGYRQDRRYHHLVDQAAENAGRIIAVSDFVRREVMVLFSISDERVVTIHSAVDPRVYLEKAPARDELLAALRLPADSGPIVASAGKLVPFKGIDTLLNAAAIYEIDPARITTVIAGDGIQRGELVAQAKHQGLQRTFFIGDLERDRCAMLFSLADLVVMPSRGEPFGLVALEAMACGTPVIGTCESGLAEIVSDTVGALVPPDDHELLALKVLEAVDQNWKRGKGPQARRHVSTRFNVQTWIDKITGVYRQVLDERFGNRDWENR